jgi:hypothetical protein
MKTDDLLKRATIDGRLVVYGYDHQKHKAMVNLERKEPAFPHIGNDVLFCTLKGETVLMYELEARAELLCRAVNSFEAMRDALKALYEHCEMVHRHWGENCNREQAEAARKAGLAALALAEGKAVQS